MSLEVRKVENKADFEAFFQFPWKLYQDTPHWVPELPSLRRETLDKAKHPAWEYLEGDYFVAWRDGQPQGTIAAFINHRHNEYHEENIGFFGFFECYQEQAIADALLQTAEDYLRAKGVSAIRGPASFSSNEMWGLLIDSYDKDPMILMPYTPPYYVQLVEDAGYHKAMDLYSWHGERQHALQKMYEADGKTETRILRATRRAIERNHISVRNINMRDKKREFLTLRNMYNAAWERNWGFIPMTDRELDDLAANLGFLLMPDYTFFGMVKGEPAGFLLLIPNFNEVLAHVNPHPRLPEAWWYTKILWHWKLRPKIRSLRAILMGVKTEYRGMGVEAALHLAFAEQLIQDHARIDWAEAGWVLETNNETNRLLENFGCYVHRKHRIYEKSLA